MPNSITIRRWRIDLYESAIYIQKQPDPKCTGCLGYGSIEAARADHDRLVEAELEPCDCWDPFHSLRIPLGRRPVVTERYPF